MSRPDRKVLVLSTLVLLCSACNEPDDAGPGDTGEDATTATDDVVSYDAPYSFDSDVCPERTWHRDSDNDGFGDPEKTTETCQSSPPSGYVDNDEDCDDGDGDVHPNAPEVCDDIDNNCDGDVDGWQHDCPQVRLLGTAAADEALSVTYRGSHKYFTIGGITEGDLAGETSAGGSDAFVTSYDRGLSRRWLKLIGSSADEAGARVDAALPRRSVLTGATGGAVGDGANSGGDDAFIGLYGEEDGNESWLKTLGGTGDDIAVGAALEFTHKNILLAGTTKGDIGQETNQGATDGFVVRYRYGDGGVRKSSTMVGTPAADSIVDIVGTGSTYVYVVGTTEGDLGGQSNAGKEDVFVAKLDGGGQVQWVTLLGSAASDQAAAIFMYKRPDGSLYVGGTTRGSLGGGSNAGGRDGFVASLAEDGTTRWTQQFGTSADDIVRDLTIVNDGHQQGSELIVTGSTAGDLGGESNAGKEDVFLIRFDTSGNRTSTKLLGTPATDIGYGITKAWSQPIVVGATEGDLGGQTNNGGRDAFLAK